MGPFALEVKFKLIFFYYFLLKDNCFTEFCYFLSNLNMKSAIGIHLSPPFWTSRPSPSPSHPSRLIQSPCQTHFLELIDLPAPARSWLWHMGSSVFVVACGIFSWDMRILSCSVWDLVSWPGISPSPLHWELGVLTTGPPGKSLKLVFDTFGLCQVLLYCLLVSICHSR